MWHDNNCRIVAMLNKDKDSYFSKCALPVDVFHFKCKHKESDVDCGRYCNPYIYSDLRMETGQWRFNSSAAEQTNAWFGGYQAIVQGMAAERYYFLPRDQGCRATATPCVPDRLRFHLVSIDFCDHDEHQCHEQRE